MAKQPTRKKTTKTAASTSRQRLAAAPAKRSRAKTAAPAKPRAAAKSTSAGLAPRSRTAAPRASLISLDTQKKLRMEPSLTFQANYTMGIIKNKASEMPVLEQALLYLVLRQNETDWTIKALAEQFETNKPSITRLVNGLEKSGYVKRVAHPTDARVVFIRLTMKAAQWLQAQDNLMTKVVKGYDLVRLTPPPTRSARSGARSGRSTRAQRKPEQANVAAAQSTTTGTTASGPAPGD